MSITTTGNLPAPILQSLAPGMLSVPTPNFNYIIPAEKYSMPRQGGTTMRFLRPVPLSPPVIQLGNLGIEPASQIATREIIDATMAFYGTSVILNEQVVIQDQDPVLSWVTERLGVAMRQAEDIILRDFLLSAASVYNCKGGVNGDNPTEITVRDLSNVASSLDTANAFKFLSGKLGEDRFGSSPIRSAYFLLCSTELQPAFDGLDKFTSSWNYPNQNDVIYSEYGAVNNMRIFTSSESAVQRGVSMNGQDVYNNMAVARESYAHIDQDGYSSQLLYRPPIFSGPLALNGTLGVKFAQAQALLQETWLRNVRCTLVS
jgi:N4-gp56 family major capsid protein